MDKFIAVQGKSMTMLADQLTKLLETCDIIEVHHIAYLPQPGFFYALVEVYEKPGHKQGTNIEYSYEGVKNG